MHGHAPVGLPVDGRWGVCDLRPRGDGRLDFSAVSSGDTVTVHPCAVVAGADGVVVVTRPLGVGGNRGRPGDGGHDVDRGGGAAVVVDGRRRRDGRGVVVAELLPQAVLHVLVRQRRGVADLVL